MPIIVIEGPDMAGKSTLANELYETLRKPQILRQGPPSGDILERYLRPIEQWGAPPRTHKSEHLILDRWHMGELVYGPLLRGKSLLTPRQADYIDMVLQTYGCTFLHVTAPLNVLEDRYDIRGDWLIKKSDLLAIRDLYDVMFMTRPHWTMTATQDMHAFQKRFTAPLPGSYIGPTRPKVLLLGDSRASDKFIYPFVPERATSGHWLMGAMHDAGVNHMDVGIINACEITADTLHFVWKELRFPPVITLGRNAEKAWQVTRAYELQTLWDPKTHYLHHPQYMRRFHFMQFREYGEQIKEIIDG